MRNYLKQVLSNIAEVIIYFLVIMIGGVLCVKANLSDITGYSIILGLAIALLIARKIK